MFQRGWSKSEIHRQIYFDGCADQSDYGVVVNGVTDAVGEFAADVGAKLKRFVCTVAQGLNGFAGTLQMSGIQRDQRIQNIAGSVHRFGNAALKCNLAFPGIIVDYSGREAMAETIVVLEHMSIVLAN